ncbi:hypothetical protein UFOVP630_26 [uncultured Caudovirales phage]|uniref:Uncharacterized protein n=1 Tax=uncultured Caudovirales phage TaxID=2100421 RepID=A0A6J5N5N4_9CAUD|nr:hypothetical protein UFOVP630_26 [uncultured Caudovirales phage]
MKEFKIRERDYQMPTNWDEVTLNVYVRLAELEEKKETFGIPELYLLRVLECLCNVEEEGDLDELTLDLVNDLVGSIGYIQQEPTWTNTNHLVIEGQDYVFPNDLNALTMGEYISIKTLQEGTTTAGIIPYILAIILRPGTKEVDAETGKERWVQEKFSTGNLEWRKELFMKQPVFNLMGPVTFFLNGKGISTTNTKDSIPVA